MTRRRTARRRSLLAEDVPGVRRPTLVLTECDKLLIGDCARVLSSKNLDGDDAKGDSVPHPRDGADAGSAGEGGGGRSDPLISLGDLSPRDWNLIFGLPFFFSVAVYQPAIYFVIQLKEEYGTSMIFIGLSMSAYNVARLIALSGSMLAPKTTHLVGTTIALLGYSVLIPFADTSNVAIFAICNVAVGFIEASAAVFVYSKHVYEKNMEKMRYAMGYQAAAIGLGVVFGFLAGGVAVQLFGVRGVATVGAFTAALELASLIYFLLAPPGERSMEDNVKKKNPAQDEDTFEENPRHGNKGGTGFIGTDIVDSLGQRGGINSSELGSKYSGSDEVVASNFTYMVSAVFSFHNIVCGYLYSIGPLFIFETFGIDEGIIGIIFSVASAFASLFTFLALSQRGRDFQNKHARSPYNIYVTVVTATAAVIGLMIPSFPVQVLCIILVHIAVEVFTALIAELQGAITTTHYFSTLGPSAQMSRKILNIGMAFTGPIMYNVFSRLPYVVSSALCVLYTGLFIFLTQRQQRENRKTLSALLARHASLDENESQELVQKYSRMSMASNECIARMASVVMRTRDSLIDQDVQGIIEEESECEE